MVRRALLALAIAFTPIGCAWAQQPRAKDLAPFERPKPLATMASASNRETMVQLQGIVMARGYTIASVDWDRGELTAVKKDAPASPNSDRVLLWLERDALKPAERASIYMMYGRFEPFFGSTEGPIRVKLERPDELARMAALRDTIVSAALAKP
jgi:hypothetical protein